MHAERVVRTKHMVHWGRVLLMHMMYSEQMLHMAHSERLVHSSELLVHSSERLAHSERGGALVGAQRVGVLGRQLKV